MTKLGDNDGVLAMVLIDTEGASLARVTWEGGRDRVAAMLDDVPTSTAGWATRKAEDILCALWSGSADE